MAFITADPVIRKLVHEITATRNYRHRLMDYNNDPTTSLSDLQNLFREALKRMPATS